MGKVSSLWGWAPAGAAVLALKRLQRSGKQRYNDYPCGDLTSQSHIQNTLP